MEFVMGMKRKLILLILIFLIGIFFIIYCFKKVDVINYTISNKKIPKEFNDFKIVQLSDFHSSGYKDTTEIIISKVKEIKPDIIVMTGDMVNWRTKDTDELEKLLRSLADVCPMYYVTGNHEQLSEGLITGKYQNILDLLDELNITFLRNEYVEIEINGEIINLYGMDIPLDSKTAKYPSNWQLENDYVERNLPQIDQSKFNILLSHNPVYLKQYSKWGADLVLSGHMHGGIIRIPIIGVGILSAEKSLFPKYDDGKFKKGDTTMIVNRGIGTSSFELRIFNNPEVSVITLKDR